MILEVENVHSYYGKSHILKGVSLAVDEAEIVTLIGRNGAGKSTTLKTIIGLVPPREGEVRVRGTRTTGLPPFRVVRGGVGYVPEERRIFSDLTVMENLALAAVPGARWTPATALERFPALAARRVHKGRHLSGGEQQMLAIARALMRDPAVLMLDEPSQGLAPVIVESVMEVIGDLRREGLSILLVEQNVEMATALATRHYVLDQGQIVFAGTTADLEARADIWDRYFALDVDDR